MKPIQFKHNSIFNAKKLYWKQDNLPYYPLLLLGGDSPFPKINKAQQIGQIHSCCDLCNAFKYQDLILFHVLSINKIFYFSSIAQVINLAKSTCSFPWVFVLSFTRFFWKFNICLVLTCVGSFSKFHTTNVLALNIFISFHAIFVLAFRSKSYLLVGMKHAYIWYWYALVWPHWTSTHQYTIYWMPIMTQLRMIFNLVSSW